MHIAKIDEVNAAIKDYRRAQGDREQAASATWVGVRIGHDQAVAGPAINVANSMLQGSGELYAKVKDAIMSYYDYQLHLSTERLKKLGVDLSE